MKKEMTIFKHNVAENWKKVNEVVQDNWFKILLVLVSAYIITRKDLNFQFALNNSNPQSNIAVPAVQTTAFIGGSLEQQAPTKPAVEKTEKAEKKEPIEKKEVQPKVIDENKAQTFYNLSFILNPDYAAKHNIDPAVVAEHNRKVYDYIKKWSPVAQAEMREFNIPASITLAQGLLESNAGDSRLAVDANNHFGIKCFSHTCKKGHCKNYTDDTHKDFFRMYPTVRESYREHSLFLQRNRYKHLQQLKKTDYKSWAHGLKAAGYATDKAYGNKLIKIIEKLKLYQYDKK
jgi:flagellum-specific peptidoglycan hydrolase FlgJ